MEHSDELFSGRQAEVELKVINDGGEASGRRRFGDATGGEETTGGQKLVQLYDGVCDFPSW